MKAYIIDNNGYYIGERECQPSPLEPGKFLIPGGCIKTPPIETGENEVAKWDGTKWIKAPNFLGKVYFSKTDRKEKRFEIGETFDSNYTDLKPIENEQFQKWDGAKWAIDPVAKALHDKQLRIAELKQLLADSDWTQLPDVVTRKGQAYVDGWAAQRLAWWNELQGLEPPNA